jgi:TIR domain
MSTTKPVIFISYSHKDEPKQPGPREERWLTFVQSHLAPAVRHGIYDLWADEDIPGGDDWRARIEEKLDRCDVGVILVSRHSLASEFIIDVEVDRLRRRREKGETEIFPIVLTHCAIETAPWISEIQLRPPNGQPLSDFDENERHQAMALIAGEIAKIARTIADKKSILPACVPTSTPTVHIAAAGAALGSAMQLNVGAMVGAMVGRGVGRRGTVQVDVSHLPETGYEHLVGREIELKRLDDAWTDRNTNILSLVAEGGAGKSALVNEWLLRLQRNDYRGAETVLGWSFYSQGTKERATSADAFLNWALEKLGVAVNTISATDKGNAIAEALMNRRMLLVLDGVEPLQFGPGVQQGQLKDAGLRALLRRFAATPPANAHGLIVLTSRLPVKDIDKWKGNAAPVLDVERLSDEAGAALLRDNGVWGTDGALKQTSHDFGGHPLALALLASFLTETQNGDVRKRDHIRAFIVDSGDPRHDHAVRVMESYEREWLAGQPDLLAIMHIVGLFDRPASGDCLRALRGKPAIDRLTEAVVNLSEDTWRRSIARLRDVRLIAPSDPNDPDVLDAHPLVREWFGARLRELSETAWKEAHGRLYEHLRDTTKEGDKPTLQQLVRLYQAIAHGCRAGRFQDALNEVYLQRVCLAGNNGRPLFFSTLVLGSFGGDLAGISWFFDTPFETPIGSLSEGDRSWVLAIAAFDLRAQGRLSEALAAMRAGLSREVAMKDWVNASISAANFSEAAILVGDLATANTAANQSIDCADRSHLIHEKANSRAALACVRLVEGRAREAMGLFAEAEECQMERDSSFPKLYSAPGYHYCDQLLSTGKYDTVRERASETFELARRANMPLAMGYDTLNRARAIYGTAMSFLDETTPSALSESLIAFRQAIEWLRESGNVDDLPRGMLARARFLRDFGDWVGASRDLDEVEEIAEPGPMKLHLCDSALERARLAFAQTEAYAPLNGMIDNSPPKPEVPSPERCAELRAEAAKQIGVAAKLIEECGYHRRDEELKELRDVLAGTRKFAELPIHV